MSLELIEAAKIGILAEVQRLLSTGVNIDFRNDRGCTALHMATQEGHENVVARLLEVGTLKTVLLKEVGKI